MAQEKPALIPQGLPQPRQKKKRLKPLMLGNEGPGLREPRGAPGPLRFSHLSSRFSHLSSRCVLGRAPGAHPAVFLLKSRLDLRDVLQIPALTAGSFPPHS